MPTPRSTVRGPQSTVRGPQPTPHELAREIRSSLPLDTLDGLQSFLTPDVQRAIVMAYQLCPDEASFMRVVRGLWERQQTSGGLPDAS